MQAAGGAAGGAEGQGSPGDSGGPDGPAGHEGPGRGGAGEAGAAAGGAPRVAGAVHAPMPGGTAVPGPGEHAASELRGQAGPAARGPGRQLLQYCIRVPFPSPMAAEMALQSLTPHVQPQDGAVRKEFIVSGNILVIRLIAEDPGQLQISITSCLDQLSLLIQNVQPFIPTFFAKPKQ